jgi:hypothetical protein
VILLVSEESLNSLLTNATIASKLRTLRTLVVWLFQKFGFFMD